jgi:hypothetical protein
MFGHASNPTSPHGKTEGANRPSPRGVTLTSDLVGFADLRMLACTGDARLVLRTRSTRTLGPRRGRMYPALGVSFITAYTEFRKTQASTGTDRGLDALD